MFQPPQPTATPPETPIRADPASTPAGVVREQLVRQPTTTQPMAGFSVAQFWADRVTALAEDSE
jgi:hypothetical protein